MKMDRRDFLSTFAVGCAVVALPTVAVAAVEPEKGTSSQKEDSLIDMLSGLGPLPNLDSFDEFVDNPYYLGSQFGGGKLFPKWREWKRQHAVNEIMGESHPRRTGYTTGTMVATLYDVAREIQNPSRTNSVFVFLYDDSQRIRHSTQLLLSIVERSPFFRRKLRFSQKSGRTVLNFENNVEILVGRVERPLQGLDIVGGVVETPFNSTNSVFLERLRVAHKSGRVRGKKSGTLCFHYL